MNELRARDEFLDHLRRNGGLVSDGPLPADFTSAWGKAPFARGSVVHYFTADRSIDLGQEGCFGVVAACGFSTVYTPRVPIFGPGNYAFCTRCENVLMKRC